MRYTKYIALAVGAILADSECLDKKNKWIPGRECIGNDARPTVQQSEQVPTPEEGEEQEISKPTIHPRSVLRDKRRKPKSALHKRRVTRKQEIQLQPVLTEEQRPEVQPQPVPTKEQRAENRKQIWEDAYTNAYLGIKNENRVLHIKLGSKNYELDSSGKSFEIRLNGTKIAYSRCPFKIKLPKDDPGFKVNCKKGGVWFNLHWIPDGTIIVNDLKLNSPSKSEIFAVKSSNVILSGDNEVDSIAVSANDRIINCGRLFFNGDCRLISDKIANYWYISDQRKAANNGKDQHSIAEYSSFYRRYQDLFRLPAHNGFYNFGVLDIQNKYARTEDLSVNLAKSVTNLEKGLTQTGDDRILRIINGDFYKSAARATLEKEGLLRRDFEQSSIDIKGLLTGEIYTNLLTLDDFRNNSLINTDKHINVKFINTPHIRYEDTQLTVDSSVPESDIDTQFDNIKKYLMDNIKLFDPDEEIVYTSSIQTHLSGLRCFRVALYTFDIERINGVESAWGRLIAAS